MATGFVSRSKEQTATWAAGLAKLLKPGDVVLLKGELGTGKTFFTRAASRELGVMEPVTSPSFTMGQTYGGKVTVHHLDLYRLASIEKEDFADFEPFFESEAVTFVEWPEQAEPFLENPTVVVTIEHIDENSRRIDFDTSDPELRAKLEELIGVAGD